MICSRRKRKSSEKSRRLKREKAGTTVNRETPTSPLDILGGRFPCSPMRGRDIQPFFRGRLGPPRQYTPAGKDERVSAVPIYDGQFQISIEGGVRYRLPHRLILGRKGKGILDAGQIRRPVISRAGHGDAFRTAIGNTAISNRVYRCWVATFRRVCHFMISLLRRPGMLIVPSARGLGKHGKTVSMVKLMSPRSIRQSASAYEINGAISEIAKSGLVLMGFHLDSRARCNLDGLRDRGWGKPRRQWAST